MSYQPLCGRPEVLADTLAPTGPVTWVPADPPKERPGIKPQPFDCWLSGVTGELVLQGVTVDPDGDCVLPAEWVQAVRRVLLGVPA